MHGASEYEVTLYYPPRGISYRCVPGYVPQHLQVAASGAGPSRWSSPFSGRAATPGTQGGGGLLQTQTQQHVCVSKHANRGRLERRVAISGG